MADRRMEIRIELPAGLVDMFHGEGNVNELLAQALELGMTEEARPEAAAPADAEDPAQRKQQALTNLIHFISVDQTVLDEAAHFFVRDSTSDPAATAITFGAALVLLRRPLAQASAEEILREVGRYWSGVASLQFRAYALGHDKQVLGFRLAAQRAEVALRKRLQS
jgi:hypothetical protein